MEKQLLWRHNAGAGKNGEFSLKCHSVPPLGTRQHLSHVAEGKRRRRWLIGCITFTHQHGLCLSGIFISLLSDCRIPTLCYTPAPWKEGFFFAPHLHLPKENTTDLKV